MGVNLPAHLVIIKSTQHYVMGLYQEYSETQILQMIGRAGRPQVNAIQIPIYVCKWIFSEGKNEYLYFSLTPVQQQLS